MFLVSWAPMMLCSAHGKQGADCDVICLGTRSFGRSVSIRKQGAALQPGKPVAHDWGLLCLNSGLLWGIVAGYFRLLGFPGIESKKLL